MRLRSALVSDLLAMRRAQNPQKSAPDLYARAKTVSELLWEKKQKGKISGGATRQQNNPGLPTSNVNTEGAVIGHANSPVGGSAFSRSNSRLQTPDDVTALLPKDREEMLANHIAQLGLLGYRYYIIQVLQLATQMSEYYQLKSPDGTLLSERWYAAFVSRWPRASVSSQAHKLVPSETLKNINWDLVDLAATQDALEQEGYGRGSGGTDQSERRRNKKSASDLLTEMIISGLEKVT